MPAENQFKELTCRPDVGRHGVPPSDSPPTANELFKVRGAITADLFEAPVLNPESTRKPQQAGKLKSNRRFFTSYFFFAPSLRIVPIFLSDLASLPSLFLMLPAGRSCFFS